MSRVSDTSTTEIERRFLVVEGWQPPEDVAGHRIVQGYLSTDPRRIVRVRNEKGGYKLAIKGKKKDGEGKEYEYDIDRAHYEYYIDAANSMTDVVDKSRYEIYYSDKKWEVDIFHGPNKGLVIAEIELEHRDEEFDAPSWVIFEREITDNFKYSNSSLATRPWSSWSVNNG